MHSLIWSPQLALGVPEFDAAHRQLALDLETLMSASDEALAAALPAFTAGVEHDFREEELRMEDIGYGGLKAHREQHATVLSALHHALARALDHELGPAHELVAFLPHWFRVHVTTMDAQLATALGAQRTRSGHDGAAAAPPTAAGAAPEPSTM